MINSAGKCGGNSRYVFLKSRSGKTVPAIAISQENALPLHSMVDPMREAQRLVSTIPEDTGFIVFLGLGGGFAAEAALEGTNARIIVIDFHKDSIAELLSSRDYSALINNERFRLLTDPSCGEIKKTILENYHPSLCGSIKTIPLRPRIEQDIELFENASAAIQEAIGIVSSDYSVQAHFGIRWFSNIVRNIKNANLITENFSKKLFASPVPKTAIVAAGPSLDQQLHLLAELKHKGVFIISTDTALPVLLQNGIRPDTAVSIDCQHISYYHFIGCNLKAGIPLVLDIASPPLLSSFSSSPVFFSGGHPLAQYVSAAWQPLPLLDTSGGNVTYACLSLAEHLGADHITLFGADFSYVESKTYARGTYIYPFFEKKQNRFSPAQSLFSAFLYRSPFLPKENYGQTYHETASLRQYRKKFEEKAAMMNAQITVVSGQGAPIDFSRKIQDTAKSVTITAVPVSKKSGVEFLEQYREDIAALPAADENYLSRLCLKDRQIFTTLLPCLAALRHRRAGKKTKELIEETKRFCIQKITSVLRQTP
ncbi:MAG: DUF115 domain-containing protein [Spirochaetes bacterium]|nr:DUF115 domain-containing protein [Spirochaetota bacterium]